MAGSLRVGPNAAWQDKSPKGWSYKDKLGIENGVTLVQLKTNANPAKSKVQVKSRGSATNWPLPFDGTKYFDQDSTVTVQLINSNTATCWASDFVPAGTKKNGPDQFLAKKP